MSSIYMKQMQELGLNPKQYAELISIPYGVVKDFIYGKEGDYEMGLRDLLRKNMLDKHQEIEQNYENAKLKATEIKVKTNEMEDIRKWYEEEYTPELLLDKLNLKARIDFDRKYDIIINGKKASRWHTYCLTGKMNYDNHEVSKDIQDQYIEQLYDILVNGNVEKYKREEPFVKDNVSTPKKPITTSGYFKWFKGFEPKSFMKKYNLTNDDLARELNLGVVTISYMVNKKHYTLKSIQKLYDYVDAVENKKTTNKDTQLNSYPTFELEEWYKNFNFKEYLYQKGLTQQKMFSELGIDRSTFNLIVNHTCKCSTYGNREKIKKIYDYIMKNPLSIEETKEIEETREIEETEEIEENDVVSNDLVSEKVDDYTPQMVSSNDNNNTNNDILRKLLVNRLTDEERELIKIFGGVID